MANTSNFLVKNGLSVGNNTSQIQIVDSAGNWTGGNVNANTLNGYTSSDLFKYQLLDISTGAISFAGLSVDTPNTTFSIGAVEGYIVDNTTTPSSPTSGFFFTQPL